MTEFPNEPISRVQWVPASSLDANDYNPNHVMTPEMKLLERSILKSGWIQPVLVNRDMIVIDGFHRSTLAKTSKALLERYKGLCPVVVMDIDRVGAMCLTVRINRAKGSHAAFRMSGIVRELIDVHGCAKEELAAEMGMSMDEIDLLYKDIFSHRNLGNHQYSKAWVPGESRLDPEGYKRAKAADADAAAAKKTASKKKAA